jgi:DNA-directed RNA polymerase specialized sigma24 family protein
VAESKPGDEVREAVDGLLVVLRETAQRNQVATRRAQTMRRLRSHGRSYSEILRRVEGALNLGITVENIDRLLEANGRLQGAEIRALYGEGLGPEEIAALLGITQKRVSESLPNRAGRDVATA